jgi:hypothetical protein
MKFGYEGQVNENSVWDTPTLDVIRYCTCADGKDVDGSKEMTCLCKLSTDTVLDFRLLFPQRGESEDASRSQATSRGSMCIYSIQYIAMREWIRTWYCSVHNSCRT